MSTPEYRPWPDLSAPERERWLNWAQQPDRHLLTLDDPRYPPLLRETNDPPPVLFVRGNVEALALPQIAIVGSRYPTIDGRQNARAFAARLSAAGYVITSGMALGIDSEAHQGTLAASGITVAVLGCGLDCIGSGKNTALATKIAQRGAVISEFLPHTPAAPHHFPQRNRIISGLAHGVLVVEAAEQSGTLITARLAGEQGREVFALPGSIHNAMARGCHRLIRQGVKLVDCVDDILVEFPALVQWEKQCTATGARPALPKRLRHVLKHIAYEPAPVDVLLQRTGCALPELYTDLMQLELSGHIVSRADGYVLSSS